MFGFCVFFFRGFYVLVIFVYEVFFFKSRCCGVVKIRVFVIWFLSDSSLGGECGEKGYLVKWLGEVFVDIII